MVAGGCMRASRGAHRTTSITAVSLTRRAQQVSCITRRAPHNKHLATESIQTAAFVFLRIQCSAQTKDLAERQARRVALLSGEARRCMCNARRVALLSGEASLCENKRARLFLLRCKLGSLVVVLHQLSSATSSNTWPPLRPRP